MSTRTCSQTLRDDVELDLSRKVAEVIHAQPCQCAMNSWRALIHFPDLFQQGGQLIEGWFVIETADCITLNQHMWCELANGRIVDPSVLLLVPPTTPVYYFAGLARSWEQARALEGQWFPHVCFDGTHGSDGLGHPGYKAAREAARRKAFALSSAHHTPKAIQLLTAVDPAQIIPPFLARDATTPLILEGDRLDISLSITTANYLPAVAGRCWYNARDALIAMPHPFFRARYSEGWLVEVWPESIRVTEHGWIWTPQRGIVDPTIVLEPELPLRLAYFPGLDVGWHEAQNRLTSTLPLSRFGPGALVYQEACQRALERAEALAWETGLPLLPQPAAITIFHLSQGTLTTQEECFDFPVPSAPSARVKELLRKAQEGLSLSVRRYTYVNNP
jgi:hypothetical protein